MPAQQTSPQQISKIRLCAEILPTGLRCKQIALKSAPWCHSHARPEKRERTAYERYRIDMIADMDVLSVAITLSNAIHEFRDRIIPPLHAQAIFVAASFRLEELVGELADPDSEPAGTHPDNNTHCSNYLQGGARK
jgi:hypothetical protein